MPSVSEILSTMDYGPAPQGAAAALDWLRRNTPLAAHIGGQFAPPHEGAEEARVQIVNPATGAVLATVAPGSLADARAALSAAHAAQPGWQARSPAERALWLRALAGHLSKQADLLTQIETLSTGLPLREARTRSLPAARRLWQHFAGAAAGCTAEHPGHAPLGVCAATPGPGYALATLSATIAPALAAGNALVLLPRPEHRLMALVLADLCAAAGLPAGVLNILLPGPGVADWLRKTPVPAAAPPATGEDSGWTWCPEDRAPDGLPGAQIIFADADLDGAVEGIAGSIWAGPGLCGTGLSRILVAEAVAEPFTQKLKARLAKLVTGDPLEVSCDLGALPDAEIAAQLQMQLEMACAEGAQITRGAPPLAVAAAFVAPCLLGNVQPAHRVWQQPPPGPVALLTQFRTAREALELARNGGPLRAAALWSESLTLALEVATALEAGTIWVNTCHLSDPAVDGAVDGAGLGHWLSPVGLAARAAPEGGHGQAGAQAVAGPAPEAVGALHKAVEAAGKATAWTAQPAPARAELLWRCAEGLAARKPQFEAALRADGQDPQDLHATLSRLQALAASIDRPADRSFAPGPGMLVLHRAEPLGIIGILAGQASAGLPDFAALLLPALAMGNRIVALCPAGLVQTVAELRAVFDAARLPAGTLSLLPASLMPQDTAAPLLAMQDTLSALWQGPGAPENAAQACAEQAKPFWAAPHLPGADLVIHHATRPKTIWLPHAIL